VFFQSYLDFELEQSIKSYSQFFDLKIRKRMEDKLMSCAGMKYYKSGFRCQKVDTAIYFQNVNAELCKSINMYENQTPMLRNNIIH